MENFSPDRYGPIKTALKELGFTVDFVEKQDQKTIITVSHYEKGDRDTVSAEEQGQMGMKSPGGNVGSSVTQIYTMDSLH